MSLLISLTNLALHVPHFALLGMHVGSHLLQLVSVSGVVISLLCASSGNFRFI